MADIKTTTMRLSEDTIKAFRDIAEKEGFTQEQCLFNLVNIFKMQQAKEVMLDRKKEIDTFEDYISKILNLYMNSLEISLNAEGRIKENFSEELKSKDEIILALNEDIKNLKFELNKKDKELKELLVQNEKIIKDYTDIKSLIDQNKEFVNKLEEEKSNLKEELLKVANFSKENEKLKQEANNLLVQIDNLNLLLRKKDLNIENSNSQILIVKENYNELKEDLKKEKEEFLQQIKELNSEHKQELVLLENKLKEENEKRFNETLELEKRKLQVEKEKELLELEKKLRIEFSEQTIHGK